MQLLCLLTADAGKVVARNVLIKEVWNDYGGADEGLTQGISFLRKLLKDDSKELIRTVPKRGYQLMASVTRSGQTGGMPSARKRKRRLLIAALVTCVFPAGLFLLTRTNSTPQVINLSSDSIINRKPQTTEVAFPGMDKTGDNNYLNTVTTTDSLGNRYRLVMIGDRRPRFYVNDSLLTDTGPYTGLVDKLAKELWERGRDERIRH